MYLMDTLTQMQAETTLKPLKITTYNVLNECYEVPSRYLSDTHLYWRKGRRELTMKYLRAIDADAYCLQEVSHAMVLAIVNGLNGTTTFGQASTDTYKAEFRARTEIGAHKQDGCAIVYRQTRLSCGFGGVVWRYPSKNHIFLALPLTDLASQRPFWLVCTHTNWETREADLLALQKTVSTDPGFTDAPKIVMGDFNAVRSEQWYRHLAEHGLVDALGSLDVAPTGVINDEPDRQVPYSYNSGKISKWIDHVLLNKLDASAVKKIWIDSDVVTEGPVHCRHTTLPNDVVPSDHIAVSVAIQV